MKAHAGGGRVNSSLNQYLRSLYVNILFLITSFQMLYEQRRLSFTVASEMIKRTSLAEVLKNVARMKRFIRLDIVITETIK